MDEVIV